MPRFDRGRAADWIDYAVFEIAALVFVCGEFGMRGIVVGLIGVAALLLTIKAIFVR